MSTEVLIYLSQDVMFVPGTMDPTGWWWITFVHHLYDVISSCVGFGSILFSPHILCTREDRWGYDGYGWRELTCKKMENGNINTSIKEATVFSLQDLNKTVNNRIFWRSLEGCYKLEVTWWLVTHIMEKHMSLLTISILFCLA